MNAGPRRALGRIRALARKELMHILRDPQVLIFALGVPVLLLLLFGYAVSFDVDRIPLAVVDQRPGYCPGRLAEAAMWQSWSCLQIVADRELDRHRRMAGGTR